MLDHVFLSVRDTVRSVAFYTAALAPGCPRSTLPGRGFTTIRVTTPPGSGTPTNTASNSSAKAGSKDDDAMTAATPLRAMADALIAATNAFDVESVLPLFASDALIDDPSIGQRFVGHAGAREYVQRYFVGYHTATRLLSIKRLGDKRARVRVDFTGDFGHEIGLLEISIDADGLIVRIDADIE